MIKWSKCCEQEKEVHDARLTLTLHTFYPIRKDKTELPGTIPSSTAALVAFKASVTLSFLSPTSASLAPPTCGCLDSSCIWGHDYEYNLIITK
jgi:hypothetical protein